jgi:hypothetical protein
MSNYWHSLIADYFHSFKCVRSVLNNTDAPYYKTMALSRMSIGFYWRYLLTCFIKGASFFSRWLRLLFQIDWSGSSQEYWFFKTEDSDSRLTLCLILCLNLRLGGYSIWSAISQPHFHIISTSRLMSWTTFHSYGSSCTIKDFSK